MVEAASQPTLRQRLKATIADSQWGAPTRRALVSLLLEDPHVHLSAAHAEDLLRQRSEGKDEESSPDSPKHGLVARALRDDSADDSPVLTVRDFRNTIISRADDTDRQDRVIGLDVPRLCTQLSISLAEYECDYHMLCALTQLCPQPISAGSVRSEEGVLQAFAGIKVAQDSNGGVQNGPVPMGSALLALGNLFAAQKHGPKPDGHTAEPLTLEHRMASALAAARVLSRSNSIQPCQVNSQESVTDCLTQSSTALSSQNLHAFSGIQTSGLVGASSSENASAESNVQTNGHGVHSNGINLLQGAAQGTVMRWNIPSGGLVSATPVKVSSQDYNRPAGHGPKPSYPQRTEHVAGSPGVVSLPHGAGVDMQAVAAGHPVQQAGAQQGQQTMYIVQGADGQQQVYMAADVQRMPIQAVNVVGSGAPTRFGPGALHVRQQFPGGHQDMGGIVVSGQSIKAEDLGAQGIQQFYSLNQDQDMLVSDLHGATTLQDLGQGMQHVTYIQSTAVPTEMVGIVTGPGGAVRSFSALPASSRAALHKLPPQVLFRVDQMVQRSPFIDYKHFDTGVIKVLLQLCELSEADVLEELRLLEATDLSNVEYMPAYLNKRLNNRLWTRRKVQQQYQQPSTFIICQATHRAPARGQLTSDHESGVE